MLLGVLAFGLHGRVAAAQGVESCPRNADFWRQQCFGSGIPPVELDRVARLVDQRSIAIDWPDGQELQSFCTELGLSTDARARARRQYIAMIATVCAFQLALSDSIFVRDATPIWSRLTGARTVGELTATATAAPCHCADSLLVALEAQPSTDPDVVALYDRLAGELTALNNGYGIGVSCLESRGPAPELIGAVARVDRVDAEWFAWSAAGILTAVYRLEGPTWQKRWEGFPTASRVRFTDSDVIPGDTYSYRLGINPDGPEQVFAGVTVTMPKLLPPTVLKVIPNPAAGALAVTFDLLSRERATLEIHDLNGRLVDRREIADPVPGWRSLSLGEELGAGIYMVTVRQGLESASAKAVIVR